MAAHYSPPNGLAIVQLTFNQKLICKWKIEEYLFLVFLLLVFTGIFYGLSCLANLDKRDWSTKESNILTKK